MNNSDPQGTTIVDLSHLKVPDDSYLIARVITAAINANITNRRAKFPTRIDPREASDVQ